MHMHISMSVQLDAYDLLSQQPSTPIMTENKCRELLGRSGIVCMVHLIPKEEDSLSRTYMEQTINIVIIPVFTY